MRTENNNYDDNDNKKLEIIKLSHVVPAEDQIPEQKLQHLAVLKRCFVTHDGC